MKTYKSITVIIRMALREWTGRNLRLRGGVKSAPRDPGDVLRAFETVGHVLGYDRDPHLYIPLGTTAIVRCGGDARWPGWILPRRYQSTCGAERIRAKNNLIGFYPERAAIVKLFESRKGLETHLTGKERSAVFDSVRIPEVRHFAFDPFPFCVETLIDGHPPETASPDLLADIAKLHAKGLTLRPIVLSSDEATRGIEFVAGAAPEIADSVTDSLKYWSGRKLDAYFGQIHGDLSLGNMISRPDGSLFLLDWE